MRRLNVIYLGPTPGDEPCAQVGQPDYDERAIAECRRYVAQLREQFGPEPAGARLRIKAMPHDFGSYHEVVLEFDPKDPAALAHAIKVEEELPARWR